VRAFFAIPLPESLQEALAVRARGVPGLSAQRVGTIHLTIRFLGEIAGPEEVLAAVEPVAAATAAFDLELSGFGVFPNPQRARVYWAGVGRGAAEAAALAAAVERALLPLGFSPEDRPFHPHVTLGRFRIPRPVPAPFLGVAPRLGAIRANRLTLYASTLRPEGPLHEPLRDLSLLGGM
jgi:2'-5' RNA ligase